MTEEFHLSQSDIVYSSENLFQLLQVLFFILSGKRNVVNVGTVEAETTQGTFDEPLEGLGGIPQPERHSQKFIRSKWGGNVHFRDIFWRDRWYARTRSMVENAFIP